MKSYVFCLLAIVSIVLAGCSDPVTIPPIAGSSDWTLNVVRMDPDTGCAGYLCRANPNSSYAKDAWNRFAVHALTFDEHIPSVNSLNLEGNWLVWKGKVPDTSGQTDIYAMNLTTREVYGVAMDNARSIRPFMDNGRVVFQYQSRNYTGLAIWEVGNDTVYPLEIGVNGSYYLSDFQGDWVSFALKSSPNPENVGDWIWNIQTNEGLQVHDGTKTDDRGRRIEWVRGEGIDLSEDYAHMVLTKRTFAEEESGSNILESEMHQVDLWTMEQRVFPLAQRNAGAVESGAGTVVFWADRLSYLMNPVNGTVRELGFELDDDCANPYGKSDWVWKRCSRPHEEVGARFDFVYYDLEDNQRRVYHERPPLVALSTATDGTNFVHHGLINLQETRYSLFLAPVSQLTEA